MSHRVSVIISTNGRLSSLSQLYQGLLRQTYQPFESIIVTGPTMDGTHGLVAAWAKAGAVKVAHCSDLNLSQSRNIGIRHAAGSLIAFIDDDAIPEPLWLKQLVAAFDSPDVGGAGGVVFDPSGIAYEFRFSDCDRFGTAAHDLTAPPDDGNFPLSARFPHFMGTNCMFRREALVGLGGFDEEYEYFLDETDVCCRMVDTGLVLRQLGAAPVHHKFLPNRLREADRITLTKYPILKNKLYFSLINNKGHATTSEIIIHILDFFSRHRAELAKHLEAGEVPPTVLDDFDADTNRAWEIGLKRGLAGERRVRPVSFFEDPPPFRPFPVQRPAEPPRTLAILAPTAPRDARAQEEVVAFARCLAKLGHTVHVLTCGATHDDVIMEDGVWLHRRAVRYRPLTEAARQLCVPEPLWHASVIICEELDRIKAFQPLDAVEDASSEGLGIATVLGARHSLAVRLAADGLRPPPTLAGEQGWLATIAVPMVTVERYLVGDAKALIAASPNVIDSAEARVGSRLRDRTRVAPWDIAAPQGYAMALTDLLR